VANSSNGHYSGPLALGESIALGWADFQLQVEEFLPTARLERELVPAAGEEGSPALLVQAPTGDRTWLPWNEPTTMPTAAGEIYAAFSPKLLQLPFGVALEDFIVDRNEGSQSVAMWTSKVRLENPRRGEVLQRKVWMNHPTWYRGWKLAQASWNPGDLSQSTLQVKREPAWVTALTFGGAALVVLGVATIFYGRSLARQFKSLQVPASATDTIANVADSAAPETPERSIALGK
ncbi:MAG: cytochrome c biogenesis protein ResB, partial [Cyanobacteria bacterium J06641_5]